MTIFITKLDPCGQNSGWKLWFGILRLKIHQSNPPQANIMCSFTQIRQAPSWPGTCLNLTSAYVLRQESWVDRYTCASLLFLTWWACWSSSILSWRIWQSYSLLFLSIWRLSFSTAVLSSSCCFSVSSSPNFITVSCCKALYKVASSSWILWLMQYQKPIRDETLFETQWELGGWWQIQVSAWQVVSVLKCAKLWKTELIKWFSVLTKECGLLRYFKINFHWNSSLWLFFKTVTEMIRSWIEFSFFMSVKMNASPTLKFWPIVLTNRRGKTEGHCPTTLLLILLINEHSHQLDKPNTMNSHNQLSDIHIRTWYGSVYSRIFCFMWHIVFLLWHVQNGQDSRYESQLVALTPIGQNNINEQYSSLTD